MRALVLSSGAVKGAYQVGVLKKWMFEEQRDYEIMCGTSVGALNVAGLAQVPIGHPRSSWNGLEKIWKVIDNSFVWRDWNFFGKLSGLWKTSLLDSQPLIDYVNNHLNIRAIRNSGRQIRVGAACLDTGEHRFGTEKDENLADWVIASSSFPIFLKPIEIEGKLWSDGGIMSFTPLAEAISLGADEIDVIMCSNPNIVENWTSARKAAIPEQLIRLINLQSDQIMRTELHAFGIKNNVSVIDQKFSHIKIRLVMPQSSLVENSLDFDPKSIKRMIEIGYNDASNFLIFG